MFNITIVRNDTGQEYDLIACGTPDEIPAAFKKSAEEYLDGVIYAGSGGSLTAVVDEDGFTARLEQRKGTTAQGDGLTFEEAIEFFELHLPATGPRLH